MVFKKRNMEANRTWRRYQLEERVTRAQTYIFVLFFFEFFFVCFCHLKDFTPMKDDVCSHLTFSVD